MEWEDKFSAIVRETESNLARVKVHILLSNSLYNYHIYHKNYLLFLPSFFDDLFPLFTPKFRIELLLMG